MEKLHNSEKSKIPKWFGALAAAVSLGAMIPEEANAQRLSIPAIESVEDEGKLPKVRELIGTVLKSLDADLSGLEIEEENVEIEAKIADTIVQLVIYYVRAKDSNHNVTVDDIWAAKRDFDEHFSDSGPASIYMRKAFDIYANSFPENIG